MKEEGSRRHPNLGGGCGRYRVRLSGYQNPDLGAVLCCSTYFPLSYSSGQPWEIVQVMICITLN